MAGARQHVLPRFLQKGFASRVKGEQVFTYVYRKGGDKPFETNTANVGVEKYFYETATGISADDEITTLENKYARLVDDLRAQSDRAEVSGAEVSDMIASFSIRTKHLRDGVSSSVEFLLEALSDHLTDYANFKKLLLNNPEMMNAELDKYVENAPVPQWQKDAFRQIAPSLIPAALDKQRPEMEALFRMRWSNYSRHESLAKIQR